jgi:Bacterial PH domain
MRALGAVMVVLAVLGLGSALLGGADDILRFGAPVTLFGVLGWAAFWTPYVEVSDGGVTVANTLRTVEVPWPAIDDVDGRYGLKLLTAYGPVTAWAASAPAGRERARREHSAASAAVSERLGELRAAGHLDDPKLERPEPVIVWHHPVLWATTLLALASIVLPLLG